MGKLKIAVLGASGIGKFHVREFLAAGANVTAILGSSKESVEKTADSLNLEFGFHPKTYVKLETLLQTEHLDAVSIATPPQMHYDQAKKCLEAGLHVLCEKPFVFNSYSENGKPTAELIALAKNQNRIVTINTQWPSVLRYVAPLVDISRVESFFMYTQPGERGIGMLWDHLPHTNSMLVKLIPGGRAEEIKFSETSEEENDVDFIYRSHDSLCQVHYKFKFKATRPRDLWFSINGVEFKREIGEAYQQKLITGKANIEIEDPFKASLKMFVDSIKGMAQPLISTAEIIENVLLQDDIIKAYVPPKGS
jgi:predicted dehydrogenase